MRNCIRPDARSIPMVVPYAGGILSGQGMLVGAFFGVAASDAGRGFDLKDWHMKALALGPVGLDTLRSELALRTAPDVT